MTLQLILTRHAKSGWGDPALEDFDRPLAPRGLRAAAKIGAWLAAHHYCPQEVLSSSARRTRQTWAGIAPFCPRARARFIDSLYLAGPDRLLQALRGARAGQVMVLAHNPGIGALAHLLAARPPDHADFARYPSGATLVLDFEAPGWADIKPHGGKLVDFAIPRDL